MSKEKLYAPIAEAMRKYREDGALAFHTPGHKQGLGAQFPQGALRFLHILVHQLFHNGSLDEHIGHILGRAVVDFTGHAIAFFFLGLDDPGPYELLLLHCLDFPHDPADLGRQIGKD